MWVRGCETAMLKDIIKISPFFNIEIQWTEEETPQIHEICLKNTLKINQQINITPQDLEPLRNAINQFIEDRDIQIRIKIREMQK